jgi:phage gp36-like protein
MYCTLDDLKKLISEETLIQLTDDESTGAVVTSRIDEATAQADGEINSYCAAKYEVPFVPVPEIIRKCSVDITVYNLFSRRVEEFPPARADRYKNAVRLLEGIAGGAISVGIDPEPAATTGGDRTESTKKERDRTVTRTGMEGF